MSVNSIKVNPGVAWGNGFGRMRVSAAVTVSGISLGNNAWGHVYLYSNSGVATVEVVTTAPTNYFGTAWQKTGDATRRYLGSVRTDASGQTHNFIHYPQTKFVRYRSDQASPPFNVLNGGTAAAETSVSCSAVAPVTSRLLQGRIANTANQAALFGTSDDSAATLMDAGGASPADKNAQIGMRPRQYRGR